MRRSLRGKPPQKSDFWDFQARFLVMRRFLRGKPPQKSDFWDSHSVPVWKSHRACGRAAAGGRWRAGHPPAGESSWEGGGRGRPGREARGSLVMCLGVRKKNVMRGQVLGCSPEAPAPRALRCVVTAPRPRARSGVAGTCRQRPPPRCCQTAHRVLLRQAWHRRRLQRPAGGRDRAAEIPAGSG